MVFITIEIHLLKLINIPLFNRKIPSLGYFFGFKEALTFDTQSHHIVMKFFYLSITKNPSEASEVHDQNCTTLPSMAERSYLGPFNNGKEALRKAAERKKNVVACTECCGGEPASISFFSHLSLEEH